MYRPSNIFVWDMAGTAPKLYAVVSATNSSTNGTVLRLSLKDTFVYAITFVQKSDGPRYVVQRIDLNNARKQWENAVNNGQRSFINQSMNTEGKCWAMSAITEATVRKNGVPIRLFGIK